MKVRVLGVAQADLRAALAYYESARPSVAADFLDEFESALARIAEHPSGWQRLDSIYRRYRMHVFPYGVIYRTSESDDVATVVAVEHLQRRPDQWRRRVT